MRLLHDVCGEVSGIRFILLFLDVGLVGVKHLSVARGAGLSGAGVDHTFPLSLSPVLVLELGQSFFPRQATDTVSPLRFLW